MATTTLIFPVNPFAASEVKAQAPQPARIDRKRSAVSGYSPQAKHGMEDAGTGAIDDFFDSADQTVSINDPLADASAYRGTKINIYA